MGKTKTPKPAKNVKRKFRFNIIDVILLVIILSASAALVYIFFPSKTQENAAADRNVSITYQLYVSKVADDFKGKINIGDSVVDSVTLYGIGEVADVTYTKAMFVGVDKTEGKYVYSEYPNLIDIAVTVKADAVKTENSISVNGFTIAVGKKIPFRVPGYTGIAYCTIIDENV